MLPEVRKHIKRALIFVLVCVAAYYIASPESLPGWGLFKGLVISLILVLDEIHLAIARRRKRA